MTASRSAVLFLLMIAPAVGCRSVRLPEAVQGPHFRVLTYNVNWGQPRPELAVEMIRQARPRHRVPPGDDAGMGEVFAGAGSGVNIRTWNSAAPRDGPEAGWRIYQKCGLREVAYVPSKTGWFDGWIVQFGTAAGAVQVLNVHLRPPVSDRGSWVSGYWTTRDDREREMQEFYARVRPRCAADCRWGFQ